MPSGRMDPLVSLWLYIQRKISDNTVIKMNKLSNYQFFEVVLGGLCLLLWSWGSAKLMGGG